MSTTNRRNVKSQNDKATDSHERRKDYLSEAEIELMLAAAKNGRYSTRDHLILLLMFRHGFRVSELIAIRLADVDLKHSRIWVERLKGGLSVEQPIAGDELRAIKRYLKTRQDKLPWLLVSERCTPFTRQNINYIVARAGKAAGLGHVNPHMFRHSSGFALGNKGIDQRLIQDFLGHRDPKHTAKYTRVAARRFEGLWKS